MPKKGEVFDREGERERERDREEIKKERGKEWAIQFNTLNTRIHKFKSMLGIIKM